MSRLTTFSRVLIIGLPTLFVILMLSMCWSCTGGCNRQNQQNYGYQQQPLYQQPVQPQDVYVQQPDGSSVMMDYLLWRSLMDQGGETHVYNYYNQHKNEPEFQSQRQQEYRRVYEQEKVQTQKSNGFGTKPVETTKGNGWGTPKTEPIKTVSTNQSNGFGSYNPASSNPNPSTTVSTQRSSGFGLKSSSSSSKTNSVSTTKSSGFGKKQ